MPITDIKKLKNTADVEKLMEKASPKLEKLVEDLADLKAQYESISNSLLDGTALSIQAGLKTEVDAIITAITSSHTSLSVLGK